MKPQAYSILCGALLLLSTNLSHAFDIQCSQYDSNSESQTVTCNAPTEYCGIDRLTGAIQGCVPISQCPSTVSDNRIIVCDTSKSSCCCLDSSSSGGKIDCNDILHPDDDSQWKQACTISLLQSPADVCKVNPTRKVYCAIMKYGKPTLKKCRPSEFCGIAKSDGEMKHCLPPSECPASGAKGSKEVVCDGSASHCCCQDIVDSSGKHRACNNILNGKDNTIWQQACSLKELSSLPVCQNDPTKEVNCEDDHRGTVVCKPSEYCGIEKRFGDENGCLDASECPSGVSDKISCDSSARFCCCRKLEDKDTWGSPCNNIGNYAIWKQACSLPELTHLSKCKEDPSKIVYCKQSGQNDISRCVSSQLCGIDKTDGRMLKCVHSSQCPAAASGSDNVVCDDSAPYCCCQRVVDTGSDELACNHILNEHDRTIWQQACQEEQLKDLSVCQHDPIKEAVYCANNLGQADHCRPFEFCGIGKSYGYMQSCIEARNCPAGAQDSEKIVCDDNAPFCCCQKVVNTNDKEDNPTCNNIQNWKDTTIWKQACALEQLKNLYVCKAPPTGPSGKPSYNPEGEEEGKDLESWKIALIVISVLIILAVIVCCLFLCYKKRRRNAIGQGGAAVQSQQQTPAHAQNGQLAAQQQLGGNYYPAQQGYNLQAGQSAPLVPVNPAYQQSYAMSMPNMRYY